MDVWVAAHRSKITVVCLTTHQTVTHKLFHSLRSFFALYITACAGGLTKRREDLHLLQTGLSLSSLLLFVIVTLSWYAKIPFLLVSCLRSGVGYKFSCPMNEVEASSRNLRRFPKLNI